MKGTKSEEFDAAELGIDPKDIGPEIPSFDDYFESKAQGVHPFEKQQRVYNEYKDGFQYEDVKYEEAREVELHNRELLGRLFGGTITPRQFEILQGNYRDEDYNQTRIRDVQNKQYLDNKIVIRLCEEHYESIRRRKVLSGEWTEDESKQRLINLMIDDENNAMTKGQW